MSSMALSKRPLSLKASAPETYRHSVAKKTGLQANHTKGGCCKKSHRLAVLLQHSTHRVPKCLHRIARTKASKMCRLRVPIASLCKKQTIQLESDGRASQSSTSASNSAQSTRKVLYSETTACQEPTFTEPTYTCSPSGHHLRL